jgi:hypothetical protein
MPDKREPLSALFYQLQQIRLQRSWPPKRGGAEKVSALRTESQHRRPYGPRQRPKGAGPFKAGWRRAPTGEGR